MKFIIKNFSSSNRLINFIRKTGNLPITSPDNTSSNIDGDKLSVCLKGEDQLDQSLFSCSLSSDRLIIVPDLDYSSGRVWDLVVNDVFYTVGASDSSGIFMEDWINDNLSSIFHAGWTEAGLTIENLTLSNIKVTFVTNVPITPSQWDSNYNLVFNSSNTQVGVCIPPTTLIQS